MIPKGFTIKANKRKLSPVIAMQIDSESQNPVTLYIKGNAKNILKEKVPENKKYNISISITDENGLAQALVIIETI